ncbi:Tetratricopeptide repeat-containing protein [Amycolatopsis sacchari]|uniref:Tetratricopeptide repeat-containing protein n=1 Tax=Amycolatopsis sacchari TaxID=115433 RepID=A0A1I4A504_9PSEU|nr:tetratricopeptide repeat protein [Amycolatopsis sacchari]SFK51482.1 Tetratricopeptide repeat-containing protein [Amycolatopsis sacchari]
MTLAQLPSVFAGRARELAELDAHREGLVILTGPAGAGKTTLALHWLHRVRADYPDGQLYADLAAFDPAGPTTPETVLHRFLTALGVQADEVPETREEREAVYRSLTAGRAVAVLLDNAVSAAQVRPLLPAGGIAVVTSRWRLAGLANYVEVGPLDGDEAVELLAELVGRERVEAEPEAAGTLATLCGGLPLALAVVAARLRARPRRSLRREADSLTRRFALRDGVFDASVVRLSPAAARLYRLGGLHPGGGFDAGMLIDVSGVEPEEVDDGLEELLDANLIEEDEYGRFRFHDLIRAHAAASAEQEPDALRRAIVEWYLKALVRADAVVHPHRWRLSPLYAEVGPMSADEAWRWLDREQAAVRGALLEAERQGWSELVWQFCEALWGFFVHRRDYAEWIELQRLGIAAAQRCGHRLAEARLRSQLGFAYAKVGRYREAVAENELALRLGRAEKHDLTMATALSHLGRAARGSGDLLAALDHFRDAAGVQARMGVPRGVALCRRRAGEVLADLGRLEEAAAELTAAARAMAELDDPVQYARTLTALASLHARRGRAEEGLALMREALAMTREAGSPASLAEVLLAFGELETASGRVESARKHLAEARALGEARSRVPIEESGT